MRGLNDRLSCLCIGKYLRDFKPNIDFYLFKNTNYDLKKLIKLEHYFIGLTLAKDQNIRTLL